MAGTRLRWQRHSLFLSKTAFFSYGGVLDSLGFTSWSSLTTISFSCVTQRFSHGYYFSTVWYQTGSRRPGLVPHRADTFGAITYLSYANWTSCFPLFSLSAAEDYFFTELLYLFLNLYLDLLSRGRFATSEVDSLIFRWFFVPQFLLFFRLFSSYRWTTTEFTWGAL